MKLQLKNQDFQTSAASMPPFTVVESLKRKYIAFYHVKGAVLKR